MGAINKQVFTILINYADTDYFEIGTVGLWSVIDQ